MQFEPLPAEENTEAPKTLPFQIVRIVARQSPTAFLGGYYDVATKTVLLRDAVAGKFVTPAEHPFIKARTISTPARPPVQNPTKTSEETKPSLAPAAIP